MTNEELIIKIKNGEKELENELYKNVERLIHSTAYKFHHKNYSLIKKICLDRDDILQIANITFVKSLEKYSARNGVLFSTYLVNAIQLNLHNELYRNKKINVRYRSDIDKVEYEDNHHLFEYDYLDNLILQESLSKLSERERDIVIDKAIIGLKRDELVNKYGMTNQAIRNIYVKALEKMREEMER